MELPKVLQLQNSRRQKPAERAGQRRHDDVQGQPEGELRAPVPPRHVVRNSGQHARLKDAQDEADAAGLREGRDEGGKDGAEAEAEGCRGEEPS